MNRIGETYRFWQPALVGLWLLVGSSAPRAGAESEPPPSRLPDKIAGAYSGWFAPQAEGDIDELIERVLDPLAAAGFNTWYHKIQPRGSGPQIDLTDPHQYKRVRQLAEACADRGLAFVAYTYNYPLRHRNPERYGEFVLDYPALVMADGTVAADRFGLANEETWRLITGAVFELARASLTLPIAGVGFDHENFGLGTISYDDGVWPDFAAEQGLDVDLAPDERGPTVKAAGLQENYNAWYAERWDGIVKRWVEAIHAINPNLSIAAMPMNTRKNWFGRPFLRHAGTEQAPALIDCWHLYNGSGLTDHVRGAVDEAIKGYNPHNLHIQWFRPDSYSLEDIRVQAYHALRELDGYSNWNINQIINPASRGRTESPEEFWQAYREANEAFFADQAAGVEEPSIPWVPVTPRVAPMPELPDPVPQLQPVGDGTGPDVWLPMRNLSQVLIHARAGETLSGEIRHLAGNRRPLALQMRLVYPDGTWLYDNSVPPGDTLAFAVEATETGTYALYVTGGEGGQAWYAVRIHNPWHVVPFAFSTPYIFYQSRGLFPLTLYLRRSDPAAPASLRVTGTGIRAQAGDAPPQAGRDITLDLPPSVEPVPVVFSRPDADEIEGEWRVPQNIRLTVSGAVYPFLGIAPERMMQAAE